MKRLVSALLVSLSLALVLMACGGKAGETAKAKEEGDLVNGRFKTTKTITVEIYDRGNDGGSKPEDNYYTDFIKAGMLKDHNVEVVFVPVPRWTEVEALNNLLASGDAPDVCVTYSYPTIQTYANMNGVLDIAPLLQQYKGELPNLWNLLGDQNIYWNKDPESGELWAIEALLFHNNRTSVFVREDWLKKLNISEPRSAEEFETMLKAFKSNASKLLGADANKLIPFSMGKDVGWRADLLTTSFVPESTTDKEMWTRGFDDRRLLWPGYKEGIRFLNKLYNQGLIWKDFPLYPSGDKTEDNNIKAGYVGAFIHNWDYPYRDADNGIHANLKNIAGEDAVFIAIEPFKNNAGKYRKYLSPPVDRKVFFPATNKEPVASLLYLDWISKLENRKYLQIGDVGVTHEVLADGTIKTIAAKGEKIMNSPTNIDYTITINGLDLGDKDLNIKSLSLAYAGVEARFLDKSYSIMRHDSYITPNFNVGQIRSEEGMGPALAEKRDNLLNQAIVVSPDKFDATFDGGMQDYLKSGGQDIIDERLEKYEAVFGR